MTAETNKFETWGMLELMGRLKLAGRLSEQTIAGCRYIRIDVPAVGDLPAYTRFFAHSAVYSLTPIDEEFAREIANGLSALPIQPYEFTAA